MEIVFTERAFVSLLSETAEKIETETGGIFLGYRDGEKWYVVESIDPGPKSTFQVAYFEYDQKYVNHLSQKIARLYKKPLELLGLWHRHPGSFDQFSGTDDGTNRKFAAQNPSGAISALVNIDPEFRLTVFYVTTPLSYQRIGYSVGDALIPEQYRGYCDSQRLQDYLGEKVTSIWGTPQPKLPRRKYDMILTEILNYCSSLDVTNYVVPENIPEMTDDNMSFVLSQIEEDIDYLGLCYMDCQMVLQDKYIRIVARDSVRVIFEFCKTPDNQGCMFNYKGSYFVYTPKLFKTLIADTVEAMQRRRLFFNINKEFVECSIQKLREN